MCCGHQCALVFQIGDLKSRQARLCGANHIPSPAHLQIFLSNTEPVLGISHNAQPPLGRFAQRSLIHQQTGRGGLTAPHASAQLMQLCQSKIFRTLDDHDRRIGHIDPHLNHRGGDQYLCPPRHEIGHCGILLCGCQLTVHQADSPITQGRAQNFEPLFCGG